MLNQSDIQKIIFHALENLNDELDESSKFEICANTRLFGADAVLDSLSLVSVIVDVESDVSDALGRGIALTDDRAMSQEISPFSDVQALTDYIMLLVTE
jgi:acyl carrier protein